MAHLPPGRPHAAAAAVPFMCACGTHIPRPTELTDEGCPTCYTVWELSGATPTIKAPSGVMYRDSAGEIRSITAEQPTVVVEVDTGIQVAEVAGPMPALDAITWLNQHAHEYRSALQLVPVEVDGSPVRRRATSSMPRSTRPTRGATHAVHVRRGRPGQLPGLR